MGSEGPFGVSGRLLEGFGELIVGSGELIVGSGEPIEEPSRDSLEAYWGQYKVFGGYWGYLRSTWGVWVAI